MSEDPVLVLPSVRVPSLAGLRVTVQGPAPPTPDELIERLYERLRESAPRRLRSDSEPAQLGDDVVCDLVVTVDGNLVPGGVRPRTTLELRDYALLPGLVDAVIGLTPSSRRNVELDLPKEYPAKEYAGRRADVFLALHEVYEVQQPEMDDPEALKRAGLGGSIQDAMRVVAQEIDEEQGEQLLITATQAVLTEFGGRVKVDLPDELIDSELLRVWEESYEETLLRSGFDDEQIDNAWFDYADDPVLRDEAILRLKTDAGLRAVAEEQQLLPDLERIERLLESTAETVGVERAVVSQVVQEREDLSKLVINSSVHLRAVEYVMAQAQVEVLD